MELRATDEQGSVLVTRAALEVAPSTVLNATISKDNRVPIMRPHSKLYIAGIVVMMLCVLPGVVHAQMEFKMRDGRTVTGTLVTKTPEVVKVKIYSETRSRFQTIALAMTDIVAVFDLALDRDITREFLGASSDSGQRTSTEPRVVVGERSGPSTETHVQEGANPAPMYRTTLSGPTPRSSQTDTRPSPYDYRYRTIFLLNGQGYFPDAGTDLYMVNSALLIRPNGVRRDDQYRTIPSLNVQPSSGIEIVGLYRPTYDNVPARYGLSGGGTFLINETFGLGAVAAYENTRLPSKATTSSFKYEESIFLIGPSFQIYNPGRLSLTAGIAFGKYDIEVSDYYSNNLTADVAVIQLDHRLFIHADRSVGYQHSLRVRKIEHVATMVDLTFGVDIAPTRHLSIIPEVMFGVEIPDNDGAINLYNLMLGFVLSPTNNVSFQLTPGVVFSSESTRALYLSLGIMVRG